MVREPLRPNANGSKARTTCRSRRYITFQRAEAESANIVGMQLHVARLCLDCEEVHDRQVCPICSSESFAFISRWVAAPERRTQPRPAPANETVNVYRQLLDPDDQSSGVKRWIKRGALGLAAVGIAGWAWSHKGPDDARNAARSPASSKRRDEAS
jgi:hypothetical protein